MFGERCNPERRRNIPPGDAELIGRKTEQQSIFQQGL
jgi:hypothetical protein